MGLSHFKALGLRLGPLLTFMVIMDWNEFEEEAKNYPKKLIAESFSDSVEKAQKILEDDLKKINDADIPEQLVEPLGNLDEFFDPYKDIARVYEKGNLHHSIKLVKDLLFPATGGFIESTEVKRNDVLYRVRLSNDCYQLFPNM